MKLPELGWDTTFHRHFQCILDQRTSDETLAPARVVREARDRYTLHSDAGPIAAEVSGRLRRDAHERSDLPAVGDWVAYQPRPGGEGLIHALLPRRSAFVRKEAGARTSEQVVAANVDVALLVSGLDRDFNLRRIERYLAMAWESAATPVVVLNKADLCDDVDAAVADVSGIAFGVPIHVVSALQGEGVDAIRAYATTGRTLALLGSSGVGKSSLLNRLFGTERMPVGAGSESTGKGRHTTTHRELVLLPGGGVVIDSPGMRELQLWGDAEGLAEAFADLAEIASSCRFRDCRHVREPRCAVRAAIEDGTLDAERVASFHRLERELKRLNVLQTLKERAAAKAQRPERRPRERVGWEEEAS